MKPRGILLLAALVAPAWLSANATPSCNIKGTKEITIQCAYTPTASLGAGGGAPKIVLKRAMLAFKTKDDNQLHVELTFTNAGSNRLAESRAVYLAIDDEAGHNYLRRELPTVDLRTLAPGAEVTFSERLLAPALRRGHYLVLLWLPDINPALRFDAAHNFLISSEGVADPKTGLNTLAAFDVAR